jgi:hypothetical protein
MLLRILFTGEGYTVTPGCWYMMNTLTSSAILTHRWLTLSTCVQSLYSIFRVHACHKNRPELKGLVPHSTRLRKEWMELIEGSANRFSRDSLRPFTFRTPKHGGSTVPSMTLKPTYHAKSISHEMNKFGEISMLAALGRTVVEQEMGGRMLVEGPGRKKQRRRQWGRLVSWCKGQLGRSTYQKEADDRYRHGKRAGTVLDEDEDEDEDEDGLWWDADAEPDEHEDVGEDEGQAGDEDDQTTDVETLNM